MNTCDALLSDAPPWALSCGAALLQDETALAFMSQLLFGPFGATAPDEDAFVREDTESYLAGLLGFEAQGVAPDSEVADIRVFLRDLGRRLRRCELMPSDLSGHLSTHRHRLAVVVAFACHLTRIAADDELCAAVDDAVVAECLRIVRCSMEEQRVHPVEDTAIFPETADRAAARSLIAVASGLGFVREPTLGGTSAYEAHLLADAREAGYFLRALLYVVQSDEQSDE
ncbi:hypothetical protein [Conexibacter sp. CPCC 206217]|uniref:hypothetical protein n=1 Tax=Conexibacter sp. CPCC 206217 TaxID=3064574 RepID=UPI002722DE98|nr:hypothetical protein [Conexibacter sp. CPCC 206217]MDO8208955.1 hypothetical protein [Conexibacter sp. CPCC 206217]